MAITIGKRIRELRKTIGMTREEVASILKCDVRTIRRYENDQNLPSTYNLIELARSFNVTTDYILCVDRNSLGYENDIKNLDEKYRGLLNNKPEDDAEYYWLTYIDQEDGGIILRYQSEWIGFTNETSPREIRGPRVIIPEKVISLCKDLYTPPAIINKAEDILVFQLKGGQAIIKKSLCVEFFSEVVEPYILG